MLIEKLALMFEKKIECNGRKLCITITHLILRPVTSASTLRPKSLLNQDCASAAARYTVASSMCDKASRNIVNLCSDGSLFAQMTYPCSFS